MGSDQTAVRIVGVLAVAVALSGCTTTRPAGQQLDDGAITAKIKTKLAADPDINPFNVDVDTLDGVVTLSGIVGEPENVQRIEEIARETEGVVEVRNELQVEDDG